MKKTFNIGQVQLHNHTVRESIMQVERAMGEGQFISIQEVTLNSLMYIDEDKKAVEGLNAITNTVVADVEILEAVKQCDLQRKHEILDHAFFFELFKRLERNGKTLFVLGATMEIVEDYCRYFMATFPKLKIEGAGSLEDCVGTDEALVNEINSIAPGAVISLLPSPMQEYFYLEHKGKISTEIWYGMGETDPRQTKQGLLLKLRKYRLQKDLEKHINGKN